MDNIEKEGYLAYALLPQFKKKIDKALILIKNTLLLGESTISISWGKDSTVLLHLCQRIKPDIIATHFYHPERDLIANFSVVENQYLALYPTNLSTIILEGDHLPNKVNKVKLWETYPVNFIGLRKNESKNRKITILQNGLLYQYKEKGYRCCPLGFWNDMDIWAYIFYYNLPYLSIYDKGAKRTTDHFSKSSDKKYQKTRLEELKTLNLSYYVYLKEFFPEMFYDSNY